MMKKGHGPFHAAHGWKDFLETNPPSLSYYLLDYVKNN